MNKYYLIDWENSTKDEILDEFEFKGDRSKIEILFAAYTYENYSGEAFLIVKKENKLYEVNADHCSCYGLENQFDLEETTIEQLEFYLEKGDKFEYFYNEVFIKEQFVDFIKNYKEKRKMKLKKERLLILELDHEILVFDILDLKELKNLLETVDDDFNIGYKGDRNVTLEWDGEDAVYYFQINDDGNVVLKDLIAR